MKNIWYKHKEVFILLMFVAVIAGLFRFVAQPLFEQIMTKRIEGEMKKIDQDIMQKKINELPQLREKMEVVKKDESKLDVFFREENALALIERLEELAKQTGNDINIEITAENNDSEKGSPKKNVKKNKEGIVDNLPGENFLTMKLSLRGDFNSEMEFMRRVENLDYFSDIISLKFSKDTRDNFDNRDTHSIFQESVISPEKEAGSTIDSKYENPLALVMDVVFYLEKE